MSSQELSVLHSTNLHESLEVATLIDPFYR